MKISAYFGEAITGIGYQFFSESALLGSRVTTGITTPLSSIAGADGYYVKIGVTPSSGAIGVVFTSGDGTKAAIGEIADDLLDAPASIDGATLREIMRGVAAVLLGKSSNGGGTYRAVNDAKNRIAATVTPGGDRTAVTMDLTP